MRLLHTEIVSDVTSLRVSVDSKTSLMTVSVVADVVVDLVVEVETVLEEVVVMISSVTSAIKTSQDAVCSVMLRDLNQLQHFLNTTMESDSRLTARISSPTTFNRRKRVSDSKVYS